MTHVVVTTLVVHIILHLKIGADTPSACGGEEAPSFFQDIEIVLY